MKLSSPSSSTAASAVVFALSTFLALGAAAQGDGTRSLDGSGKAGGKIMTRDELRVCMKQQDELAKQRVDIEARRTAVNKERDAIQAENEAIKVEQAAFRERNGKVKELNQRLNDFAKRVEDYNQRTEALAEERAGPFTDKKRKDLDKEKAELKRLDAENQAEGAKLKAGLEESMTALNARVDAQQKVAASWNARSAALDEETRVYEDKRVDWKLACGDRRFREDDEKAIRAGK